MNNIFFKLLRAMKNLKPFGPSIGKTLISKRFMRLINKVIDGQIVKKTAEEISQSIESASEVITEVAKKQQFKLQKWQKKQQR